MLIEHFFIKREARTLILFLIIILGCCMPDKLKYKIQLLESIQLSAKNTKQNRECGIRGFMDMLSVCITVVIIRAVIFC